MDYEVSSGGRHIVCQYNNNIATFGFWLNRNPLNYSVPLILLQLSAITFGSLLIEVCLHPLGQSSIVAQILSGILFGPSVLSHNGIMGATLFPARSVTTLETAATFGIMFFLFAIGIRTDTHMMVRPSRPAVILGFSAMFVTLLLSVSFSLLLRAYVRMDDTLATALPFIAAAQCLTAFSNVSCLLIELRMASTDLGQLASSTATLCDMMGIMMFVVVISVLQSGFDPRRSVLSISSAFVFLMVMACLVGPIVRRAMKRIPTGKPLGDPYVLFCFVGVLVTGFVTEIIGQHFMLGPLILGFVMPDGPPLGGPIISKLDLPIGKFLYPTFLTTSGLKTNVFKIEMRSFWIVVVLILFACLAKIGAIMLASRFLLGMYCEDAFVVGLMLNARGIWELLMYNLWRDAGVLTDQEFALSVLSVVGVTAILAPLIRFLYDPSRRQSGPLRRRTIQHTKHGTELRLLVCIKDHESVPSLVSLLEASSATKYNPVAIVALVLEELVGRATPMLLAHQYTRAVHRPDDRSRPAHVGNALRQLEANGHGNVTVQTFVAVAHLELAHDDICQVAWDQDVALVILPFHKRWEIDRSVGTINKSVQSMNVRVLAAAPCSVGILVDRGAPAAPIYRVAVVYIGGPDDSEALSYGARMGAHCNVTLTVVRFLLQGCDSMGERMADSGLVNEVRATNMENQNFVYREEVVADEVGLAGALGILEKGFDLVIVGREHGHGLKGLAVWSECPELGVVGDLLSSEDYGGAASVLVVQQQRMRGGGRLISQVVRPAVVGHEEGHDYCSVGV